MSYIDRRTFIKNTTAALGAGLTAGFASSCSTLARPIGANGDIRAAVVGFRSKGRTHIHGLAKIPGVRIVALCDVDPNILARETEELKKVEGQGPVFATTDARKLLERDDIDVISIATCNHWHALLTVWACQAGKDVYVEKPVSHTLWEGQKMVEAAAKYGRVVQAGTQFRSDTGIPEAIQYLKEGHLGRIQWIHAVYNKLREPIGLKLPWYPDWLDYDMYCGPSPMTPLKRNELHYDWHWSWATGNGDLGNLGVHVLDISRWFAGHTSPPRRAISLGGRFVIDDAAETPNTLLALYDYSGVPVLFEGRGLPSKPGVKYVDPYRGIRSGGVVQCEGGYYAGYAGGAIYDNDGTQIKKIPGDGGQNHMSNFVEAVRNHRPQDLAAPIQTGHGSTAMCHYGNISYRTGREAGFDEARQALEGFTFAQEALDSVKEHLAEHDVDLEKQPLTLGRWVRIGEDEGIAGVEGADETTLERARFLLKDPQRPPFAIPDQV